MHTTLTVLYTDRLKACHAFYRGLGFDFVKEQHGDGPEHYAAQTQDGCVWELYPSGRRPATGYLRLGFTVQAARGASAYAPGQHRLTDPDGRTVILSVLAAAPSS
ncbi:VOC family protein [Streptomyces sp. NPDC056500]|uniref:VOC family protein n=1 Tax=Streptomyces sp. NPDC056500 TaxID=3345840 RepID=UPI0036989E14